MAPRKIICSSIIIVFSLFLIFMHSCKVKTVTDLSKKCIIPVPQSVSATFDAFEITRRLEIVVDEQNQALRKTGEYLASELSSLTGMDFNVTPPGKRQKKGRIYLRLVEEPGAYQPEGYGLYITEKSVVVEAVKPAGLFRGVQTLRQIVMLESCIYYEPYGKWIIPTGEIRDYPEYAYRGTMLDVSRHFFGVEEVKRYIDLLSLYKINALHLHLTDDQGWRIEIKSWPELTEIGGSSEVGGGEGGFYTQEEYKEIVSYAANQFITVIPEIDMPGHTQAALASYPELNCDGKLKPLYDGTKVGFSSLCTDKEVTYRFINDVIGELAAMTPGPYIHIGGDESHSTPLEDYIPFIEKVQEIVRSHGKTMIGWDEIALARLDPSTVAQYWAHRENAIKAVEQGSKILMSPAQRCYLDMKYDSTTSLGLHWAGYIDLDSAYLWDPATLVKGIGKKEILGLESPLWTETVTTMEDIEYMAFPRLIAHAEVGWSNPAKRNWTDFKKRMAHHGMLLDSLNVNYYHSPLIRWMGEPAGK